MSKINRAGHGQIHPMAYDRRRTEVEPTDMPNSIVVHWRQQHHRVRPGAFTFWAPS